MPPIAFEIDTKRRLVIWRSSGRITPEEADKMRREINERVQLEEGWNALLDLREQENALPTEHMKKFVDSLPVFPHPVRWAILVSTTVAQGMVNMLSMLTEEKNVWVCLFDRLDAAEAWLAESTDGNAPRP